jgi:hypothetical protein
MASHGFVKKDEDPSIRQKKATEIKNILSYTIGRLKIFF